MYTSSTNIQTCLKMINITFSNWGDLPPRILFSSQVVNMFTHTHYYMYTHILNFILYIYIYIYIYIYEQGILEFVLEDFILPLKEKEGRANESLLMWGCSRPHFEGFWLPSSSSPPGFVFEAGSGLARGQCDNQGWWSLFFQRLFLRFLCFIGGREEGQ